MADNVGSSSSSARADDFEAAGQHHRRDGSNRNSQVREVMWQAGNAVGLALARLAALRYDSRETLLSKEQQLAAYEISWTTDLEYEVKLAEELAVARLQRQKRLSTGRAAPSFDAGLRTRWSRPMERGQLLLLLLISVLTGVFWTLSIQQARTMDMPMGVAIGGGMDPAQSPDATDGMGSMPGMAMEGSSSGQLGSMAASGMSGMGWAWEGFLAFLLAWSVMMAAMMFPAAAPMILFFQKVATQRAGQGRAFVPTWVFVAGYLLIWMGIGVAAWVRVLIRLVSDIAGRFGETNRETWAPLALGAVLIAAGLYQFTPLKRACLRQCQSPVEFVLMHWREGRGGALRMGVAHECTALAAAGCSLPCSSRRG